MTSPQKNSVEERFDERFGDPFNRVEGNVKIVATGIKLEDISDFILSEIALAEAVLLEKIKG